MGRGGERLVFNNWFFCQKSPEIISYRKIPFFQFVHDIFIARFGELGEYDREVEAELDKCHFNQEQREFIWKWVRGEINLVAKNESK